MIKRAVTSTIALALFAGSALAKLPAPPPMTDEQKAKAEDAKAKAAEAAKKEGEQLARYQDKAADNYRKGQGKAKVAPAPAQAKK
jgi:hypothetical protein